MKKDKMKMLVKRLPNEGLLELQTILNQELTERSISSRYIKSNFGSIGEFCESTLPKELRSGKNTKNDNKSLSK